MTYEYIFVYTCHVFLLLLLCLLLSCCCCRCSAAACCCCSSSCTGWHNLLLWFLAPDSSVFFLFIPTRVIFMYPLAVLVACAPSICIYIVGNYGHVRSQGGRQPAVAKLLQYAPGMYVFRDKPIIYLLYVLVCVSWYLLYNRPPDCSWRWVFFSSRNHLLLLAIILYAPEYVLLIGWALCRRVYRTSGLMRRTHHPSFRQLLLWPTASEKMGAILYSIPWYCIHCPTTTDCSCTDGAMCVLHIKPTFLRTRRRHPAHIQHTSSTPSVRADSS